MSSPELAAGASSQEDERSGDDEAREAEAAATHKHEVEVEEREAYEYWGYLFKPDKTGTNKLKSLMRGLKDVIVRCWFS